MSGPLVCAKFDPTHTYLASAIQALDSHQVRVQSIVLAPDLLNTLFALKKNTRLTTLAWISHQLIALCLHSGNILIYQPSTNSIVAELESPTNLAVADFHYSPISHTAWSADTNSNIFEWDLQSYKLLQKMALSDMLEVSEKISKIASVPFNGDPHLLVGTHNVYLVDVFGKKIVKTFPAHVQPISQILTVPGDEDLFLTSAEGDRFANIYSISKNSTKAVLVAESFIQQITLGVHDNSSVAAVVAENGSIELFQDPLNFEAAESSSKKRRQLAVQSKHSSASLKFARPAVEIRNPDDENLYVNAISATDGLLHVTWLENGSMAHFDALPWLTDSGFAFSGSKTIEKSKQELKVPSHSRDGHDVAAPKLYTETHTVVTEGTAFQNDLEYDEKEDTLAERLEKLNGHKTQTKTKRLQKHTAGTLTVVLSQALRNNDHSLLETVLTNRDPTVVQNTISRLDSSLAVVLLDRLAERITRQQLRFDQLNFWLKWIIIIHGGVLSSMPNLNNKLDSLHTILTKKANTLPRLLELQGRLNMLQLQSSLKKEILNGSVSQNDYDDADTDVEYVEEMDDAVEAGIVDSGDEMIDGVDDYEESDAEMEEEVEEEDGLSDVETAVAHTDVVDSD